MTNHRKVVRRNNLLLSLTVLAVAIAAFSIAMVAYWLVLQPDTFDSRVEQPIRILNESKSIKVGDRILMELTVDIPEDPGIVGESSRFIECRSGNLITLTSQVVQLPPGQNVILDDSVVLPAKIIDGDICNFLFRVEYVRNPLVNSVAEFRSESFRVLSG